MIKSPYKWSPKAQEELNDTIDYILEEFGKKSAQKFKNKVDELVERIRINKQLCPAFKYDDFELRRCVITKQSSLSYIVDQDRIYILSIYGNRTDHSNH